MKIQITREMLDKARLLSEEFAKLNTDKENHIFKTEDNLEKKRIGFLGELAFEEFLKQEKLNYEKDDCLFREDKYDFLIGSKKIDIKTTTWMYYNKWNKLYVNKTQAEKDKIDVFIYVVIHLDKAEIFGFIERNDLIKLNINTIMPSPAYEIDKTDLKKIEKILSVI